MYKKILGAELRFPGHMAPEARSMSRGPISRKVTLPSGALGVVFDDGSTLINQLREGSPLLGLVQPGERVVAFTREDGSMIECTGMTDAALARELKQTAHQSGRIITVVAPTGAAMVERERRVQEAAARVEAVVALPAGALGLQFKRGSTIISAVGAASPVSWSRS